MRTLFCCAAILLSSSSVAWAQAAPVSVRKVALAPVSGINVHPGYLDAARDILKEHLLSTGRFAVVSMPGESSAQELMPEQAIAQARPTGAELVIITHLVRLSGVGRLRLTAYRIANGDVAHSDGIAVAGGPDDLDPALQRLAVGLATGEKASQNSEIDSVTQKQSDPLLKETATKIFGVRVSTMVAFNRPAGRDTAALPGIGIFWLYDARTFMGEIALDLHSAEENTSFALGIGGYYPFSKRNFTPYVGGSAAYSSVGGGGGHGLRLQPSFGFLFGRVSTIQFRGEVGYFLNTFGERNSVPFPETPAGDRTYAHGPQLSVGLGF